MILHHLTSHCCPTSHKIIKEGRHDLVRPPRDLNFSHTTHTMGWINFTIGQSLSPHGVHGWYHSQGCAGLGVHLPALCSTGLGTLSIFNTLNYYIWLLHPISLHSLTKHEKQKPFTSKNICLCWLLGVTPLNRWLHNSGFRHPVFFLWEGNFPWEGW